MPKNKSSAITQFSSALTIASDSYVVCSMPTAFYLSVDSYDRTKIHYAAMNGKLENIRRDISVGNFYLDQVDCCGRSALHYTATEGDARGAQILLLNGASPNLADIYGYTPMHYAAEKGHIEVVRELIRNKGELHSQARSGIIPLHLAALNGHVETEKLLLDNGANVNHANNKGETALHLASVMGYLSMVQMLIARDANINSTTLNGKTPLNYADNFEEIKNLLLDHGAPLGGGIPDPSDPIHLATPLPNKYYTDENLIIGNIYDYFKVV